MPELYNHVHGVTEALEVDPATMGKILGKAMSAWRAAEAAKKARELVRRKSVLTKSTLPGKLADCTTSNKAESEIFVVEGDSAGVSVSVSVSPTGMKQEFIKAQLQRKR